MVAVDDDCVDESKLLLVEPIVEAADVGIFPLTVVDIMKKRRITRERKRVLPFD